MPGHAGLLGNDEADHLANLGSSEEQDRVPIDLNSAKGAIRRLAKDMAHRHAKAAHPYIDPTPHRRVTPVRGWPKFQFFISNIGYDSYCHG